MADYGTLDELQAKIARAQAEWLRLFYLVTNRPPCGKA
jgi:hypothetical protein